MLFGIKVRIFAVFAAIAALSVSIAPTALASSGVDAGTARAILVIDAASGRTVLEKNAGAELPAAGLTRLAALLAVCEAFDCGSISVSDTVGVSSAASRIGGTTAFLRTGESIGAESLILAAAMINAGDALHALAEAAFGSETGAVMRINERLASLGAGGDFDSICGEGHALSAMELAAIGAALIKSPTFQKYGSRTYEHISHEAAGETELANPNRLLRQYSGCIGVGTGSSGEAGYCGVFAAKRSETTYIAVVLGAETGAERFELGRRLLDYGFSAFRSVKIGSAGETLGSVPVRGSILWSVPAVSEGDTVLLVRTASSEYTLETELPDFLAAPVEKGKRLGKLIVRNSAGELIAETALVAGLDAPASGFLDCLKLVLNGFVGRSGEVRGE